MLGHEYVQQQRVQYGANKLTSLQHKGNVRFNFNETWLYKTSILAILKIFHVFSAKSKGEYLFCGILLCQ